MQHTPEQTAVISAPAGNILVSAAAGSGKTAVLTDRIVSRIMAGELDVRQVLVMTFTEAAARNMKTKIEQKLRASLAAATDFQQRRHLGRQIANLPGAAISTIHAFCLDVIRNFYTLARDEQGQTLIEPGFSVDDGIEADLLLRQTLDEWMAEQYEAIDRSNAGDPAAGYTGDRQSAFYSLIDGYGSAAGDQPVRDLILHLHNYLRSLPDYRDQCRKWLADLRAAATSFSDSPHMMALLRQLRLLLDRALAVSDELENLLASPIRFIGQPDRNNGYIRQFQAVLAALHVLGTYLAAGGHDWDEIRRIGSCLADLDMPRASKNDSPEKTAFLDLFIRHVAEVIYCLSGQCGTAKFSQHFAFKTRFIFDLSSADIQADIAAMIPAAEMLFELVLGLDRQYAENKRSAGMIDFSDFEHLALHILRSDEARQYYRGRFQEIYVDEYQDTSSIQEKIIEAISHDHSLMVGDIKQSIYRFRHAQPYIFIDRMQQYRQSPQAGKLFELNKNFRSVAGILSAVNQVFRQLMSRSAGEIDYDSSQALVWHRPDDPARQLPVSLVLVNIRQEEAEDSDEQELSDDEWSGQDALDAAELSRVEKEALAAAVKILALHDSGTAWRDIAILGRTRAIIQACRTQLESCAIPVLADTGGTFLDTPIMRQMEALVRLIDNLRQDIPLAAVLRSELFQGGFNDQELVCVKLHACSRAIPSRFFHEAAEAYLADGPDPELRQRLNDFYSWIGQLRIREQMLSLGELIGLIFDESGWLERLAAHPAGRGEQEIQQLRLFRQWAEQFEKNRPRGLHAFISYLDSLRLRGGIDSPFAAAERAEDAVRIMTIHGSKGLEFPVVFIVGTRYDLTPKDSKDHLLISENLGLGLDFADPERQIRYPTHLKLAMLEELRAAGLAEELRLLYVAMTRAMDQLYLIGSVMIGEDKAEKKLASLVRLAAECQTGKLPYHLVLAGRSYLDWLMMALARSPGLDLAWLEGGEFPIGIMESDIWRLESVTLPGLLASQPDLALSAPSAASLAGDPAGLLQTILDQSGTDDADPMTFERVAASYRFAEAARIPLKLTVSELKRREQVSREPGDDDQTLLSGNGPRGIPLVLHEWADFIDSAKQLEPLPAQTMGILMHAFFRYMDIAAIRRNPGQDEIARQLEAMQNAGIFTSVETAALALMIDSFADFARSDVCAAMNLAQQLPGRPLHREIPFTLALPACQVHTRCPGLASDDQVFVQGIIDCWYEDESGITLLDYKSDRLSPEPLICQQELDNRYGLQLEFYARAIEANTGKPVRRRLIWLIRQGRAFELQPKDIVLIQGD